MDTIATQRGLSDNRVLVELIERGIEVRKQKQRAFFELADRFRAVSDPEQVKRLSVPVPDGKLALGRGNRSFILNVMLRGRQRSVLVTVVGN